MRLLNLLPLLPGLANGSPTKYEDINKAEPNTQAAIQLQGNPASPTTSFSQPPATAATSDDSHSHSYSSSTFPSWSTSHLLARRLLALSTTGVLSTVFQTEGRQAEDLRGVPVGLPDYIADCVNDEDSPLFSILGPGNPLILGLNIGTTFRNVKAGSNISLAVDWWHTRRQPSNADGVRQEDEDEGPIFSLAGLPRLSLIGTLEPIPQAVPEETRKLLEKCFLLAHPDAAYWLPGDPKSPHSGFWARLVVHDALWIGGFGDRARIGWLDMDAWRDVTKHGRDGERGWDDVKLPGE
jgi:hypothetical protein